MSNNIIESTNNHVLLVTMSITLNQYFNVYSIGFFFKIIYDCRTCYNL